MREVILNAHIDIICVDETKLDSSFPDHQFKIEGYQLPPFKGGRNSKGGGKLVYLREGFIVKKIIENRRRGRKSGAYYLLTVRVF